MFSFPFYKQHDSMDCGPTCLRIIAKYYKKNIPIQYFREKAQIGKDGVNLLGISDAAESIGFRTISARLKVDLLKEAHLPCILHWNQSHFVVLYKVRNNTFYISDPARGLTDFKKHEMLQRWAVNGNQEGVALMLDPSPLFFEKSDEVSREKEKGLSFGNILKYVLPYKRLFAQLFLGLGIGILLQMFLPFLTKSIVDIGINTSNIHFIYIILFAQMALVAGRLVVEFIRGWIMLHISTRVNISIITDFLIKLTKLPVSFFDSKKTGDLLQRMNDHSRIESFLTGTSLNVMFSIISLLVYSMMLIAFNTTIFLVVIAANIIYALWIVSFLKRRKRLDYKRFDVSAQKQTAAIQMVQGMQEIKLYGCEKLVRWRWEHLQARAFKLGVKGLNLSQWQSAGAFLINESKNLLITFLSARAVIEGQMTLGTMLAVQFIIGQINNPISQLIGFMESLQNAKISMDRLNEIHTIEDEEPAEKQFLTTLPSYYVRQFAGGKRENVLNVAGENYFSENEFQLRETFNENHVAWEGPENSAIYFRNVTYTYSGAGNQPVLKDLNFAIPMGKTTAIVGTSGSGKTTILKLLLKFYEPQKGDIQMDGTSLNTISHRVWRRHCGIVMQESFIFSDTIAKNIAVGVEDIDIDRLNNAALVANIREFIDSLPIGFNTKIGAEGVGISAGQRQRILIARAVYRNPDFIFFDEATNSLDANNEKVIMNNLEEFFIGKTVVVVAHRLSTVRNADQIILLNKGVVEEKGTHEELVNLKGAYYTLIKNQLELGN